MSRFWGVSLIGASLVPLAALALGHGSPWTGGSSAAVLIGVGLAAWLARVGDVLLVGSLVVLLMLVFWDVGPAAQMGYATVVLGVAGLAVRGAQRHPAVAPGVTAG